MKKNYTSKIILFILLCFFFGKVNAQTVYIGPWDPVKYPPNGGCNWENQDNNATGAIDDPFASWEAAFAQVVANNTMNQTIQFLPDTYIQNYDYDVAGGFENCTGHSIDGEAVVTAALSGLQILGNPNGCGTFLKSSGSEIFFLQIQSGADNVVIQDLYLYLFSGAILINDAQNVTVSNVVIDDCNRNATMAVEIISNSRNTSATFNNSVLLNHNTQSTTTAMEVLSTSTNEAINTTVTFNNTDFVCNRRQNNQGGALYISGTTRDNGPIVNINGGSFSGNEAEAGSGEGGAISITANSTVNIIGAGFCNNISHCNTGSGSGGGAIAIKDGSDVDITNCIFEGNQTGNYGGAISLMGTVGGNSTLDISGTIFNGNLAGTNNIAGISGASASTEGGAVIAHTYTNTTVDNSLFINNGAPDKGGAYATTSNVSGTNTNLITNSTFTLNTGGSSDGGGIGITSGNHTMTVDNSVISNNNGGANYDIERNGGSMNLTNSIYGTIGGAFDTNTGNTVNATPTFDANFQTDGGNTGWTGTFTAAACATYTCANYCPSTVAGVCLAASEIPSVCVDASAQASISGQAWEDVDGDGDQVAGDDGIAGLYVLLYDSDGNLIGTTTTDSNGDYIFNGIAAGDYYVVFATPSNLNNVTLPNSGSGESTDSDITNPITNATGTITLTNTSNVTDVDGGFTNQTVTFPIEMTSFTATSIDCSTTLNWSTAQEENNDYFEVLKSKDGSSYTVLGTVKGNETSSETSNYSYFDDNAEGQLFYKLRQVDFDGNSTESQVVSVVNQCGKATLLSDIYPNPTTSSVSFDVAFAQSNMNYAVIVYDVNGKILIQNNETNTTSLENKTLDLSLLSSGIYFISLQVDNEVIFREKVVKK